MIISKLIHPKIINHWKVYQAKGYLFSMIWMLLSWFHRKMAHFKLIFILFKLIANKWHAFSLAFRLLNVNIEVNSCSYFYKFVVSNRSFIFIPSYIFLLHIFLPRHILPYFFNIFSYFLAIYTLLWSNNDKITEKTRFDLV